MKGIVKEGGRPTPRRRIHLLVPDSFLIPFIFIDAFLRSHWDFSRHRGKHNIGVVAEELTDNMFSSSSYAS